MANDKLCVFCGQKVGSLRSTTVPCGYTYQYSCRPCAQEMAELEMPERCRRALIRGLAEDPELLRDYIRIITESEERRPTCLSCGGRLQFMDEQTLDNSPHQDGLLGLTSFDVIPACCPDCGRYEFYNPTIVRKNRHLSHLIRKDTAE